MDTNTTSLQFTSLHTPSTAYQKYGHQHISLHFTSLYFTKYQMPNIWTPSHFTSHTKHLISSIWSLTTLHFTSLHTPSTAYQIYGHQHTSFHFTLFHTISTACKKIINANKSSVYHIAHLPLQKLIRKSNPRYGKGENKLLCSFLNIIK